MTAILSRTLTGFQIQSLTIEQGTHSQSTDTRTMVEYTMFSHPCMILQPELQSSFFPMHSAKAFAARKRRVRFTSQLTVETRIPNDYSEPLPPARPSLVYHKSSKIMMTRSKFQHQEACSKSSLKVSNVSRDRGLCEQNEIQQIGYRRKRRLSQLTLQ